MRPIIDLHHPHSQAILDYWQSLPREGLLPLRSSFLPEEIPNLLPTLTIFELVSADFIKFRLAGTTVCERMGLDPTGENYLDYVAPERRVTAGKSFFAVVEQPCGMRVVTHHGMSSGQEKYLEIMMLPLMNDRGEKPIVLCQGNEIKCEERARYFDAGRLKNITIMRRDFIDIGAGVSDFKD